MRPEVIALFREVADRSPAERTDYYARREVPESLRAELESLLRYDESGDSLRRYVASAERLLLDDAPPRSEGGPARKTSLPEAIGRFEVTELLGRGGMGEVYLARDPVIDRPVAIKLIGSELDDEAARRRLVREARTAGRLRHPNIVTIFEAGEHESRSYIAMEYVPGESLGALIRRRAAVPLRRRLEMMEGACAGLAHAHRAGVVHLDIKPDNLMLDDTGVVKVLDFGISRRLQGETLVTAHVAGTLRYMSPEQIQGRPLDHRSDVFSLGCSLFELVSYAPAFSGSTKEIVTQIAQGPVPSLLVTSPDLDPRLEYIVTRAMALDPSDRFDDLEELRAELARVRAGIDPSADEPQAAPPLGVAPRPATQGAAAGQSRPSRHRITWRSRSTMAAALGTFVLAGAAGFVGWNFPGAPGITTAPIPAPAAASAAPEPQPAAEAAQPSEPGDDVWRSLARGDRVAVLERLEPDAIAGATPASAALARAVVDTVRETVLHARDSAAAAGGAASDTYRAGEEQLARANRLAAAGQPLESLRAFWRASDLYERAAATPPPPVATAPDPSPATAPSVVIASAALPAMTPEPVPPPPAAPSTPLVPAPAERRSSAAPPPVPPRSEAQDVLDTLARYDAAFESLSLSAVLAVFPSLGRQEVEDLRRTFEDMSSYELEIRDPRVDVAGDTAAVHATVARRMSLRVGRQMSVDVPTEFRLRRSGGQWVIVGVTAR